MNEATASVTPPLEIEWGFVRARRSTGGRAEYLAFLHQMRAYWPKARPLVGEDPSIDDGHRQRTLLIGRTDDPPTQTYVHSRGPPCLHPGDGDGGISHS